MRVVLVTSEVAVRSLVEGVGSSVDVIGSVVAVCDAESVTSDVVSVVVVSLPLVVPCAIESSTHSPASAAGA